LTNKNGHGPPVLEVVVGNREEAVEFSRLIEAKATDPPVETVSCFHNDDWQRSIQELLESEIIYFAQS
jgi:hypothetical protein